MVMATNFYATEQIDSYCTKVQRADYRTSIGHYTTVIDSHPSIGSVACLPLVTLGDDRGERVTYMGIRIAELIAEDLGDKALSPQSSLHVLARAGMPTRTMHLASDIEKHGDRLGCDVIVYGTIKETPLSSGGFGRMYRVEITSKNFIDDTVDSTHFELRSDSKSDKPLTSLHLQTDTQWSIGELPETVGSVNFDDSMENLLSNLAKRVAESPAITIAGHRHTLYIAPLQTWQMSQIGNDLFRFKLQFAAHVREQAESSGEPATVWRILGRDYKKFEDAKEALQTLNELYQSSPAGSFAENMTDELKRVLEERLYSSQIIEELKASEQEIMMLHTDLAIATNDKNILSRTRLLNKHGVTHVVVPSLHKIGRHYSIRAKIYYLQSEELGQNRFLTASQRVPPAHEQTLANRLGEESPQNYTRNN